VETPEPLAALFRSPGSAAIPACVIPGEDQPPRSNGAVTTKAVITRLFSEENDADDFDWPPRSYGLSHYGAVTTKAVITRPFSEGNDAVEPIAIIGIHGCYPHAANLDEYWDHLKHGRDLIEVVSPKRWDCEEFYHPDPAAASDGKIYCKWGGFLEDYDKFDPHFFKISPEEAKAIDPQERLFLESVWAAIEDAGYTRDSLKKRFPKARSADVGVFVGVTTNSYHLWAPEEHSRGNFVCPGAMPWSIANRVSYFFDFNGPSMPVDTACSSSLVALHLACESLRSRECQVAIAERSDRRRTHPT